MSPSFAVPQFALNFSDDVRTMERGPSLERSLKTRYLVGAREAPQFRTSLELRPRLVEAEYGTTLVLDTATMEPTAYREDVLVVPRTVAVRCRRVRLLLPAGAAQDRVQEHAGVRQPPHRLLVHQRRRPGRRRHAGGALRGGGGGRARRRARGRRGQWRPRQRVLR
ncbi:hypothetical protein HPB48_017907 [Haemaphysalis longicornis]|uniref:Uncharacterized protein n=1 Tax=Haemaphysalis longicornis TaxID=44386 RepID=A0A9J6GP84_HAELO|nr:hypothetical protein HPB48_017907 [Haemaphysalis longicornis]